MFASMVSVLNMNINIWINLQLHLFTKLDIVASYLLYKPESANFSLNSRKKILF